MSEEYLILVDEKDNPIGTEEKVKCHLPNGILHRAFTAFGLMIGMELLQVIQENLKLMYHLEKEECLKN
jgi:isopentenyl-diphosphate delta-isomerase